MQEAILAEMRAQRVDLDARAQFTPEGESVTESRQMLCDSLRPEEARQREFSQGVERSAMSLNAAASSEQFDVG